MNHLDTVTTVYDPETTTASITTKQREHCLELLEEAHYNCIAGAANPDNESDMSLATLADYALEETAYSGSRRAIGKAAVIGPNPYVETGIGLWTQPQ